MVAKITSGKSLYGVLAYNKIKVDDGKGRVIFCNDMIVPEDPARIDIKSCMRSFEPYLNANRNTKKPIFHVSLNPSPEDELSDAELHSIAQRYMQEMGYEEQPYIVYLHNDIERMHLHVVSVRVNLSGKKLDSKFEARRSMKILRNIERDYKLHPAVKGESLNDSVELKTVDYQKGNVKQQIASVVRAALSKYRFSSVSEFDALLRLYNVCADQITGSVEDKPYSGIVYEALDDRGVRAAIPIKSSKIGKDVGYAALQKKAELGAETIERSGRAKNRIRAVVRQALRGADTKELFAERLRALGADVYFRINDRGRIYGVTFIDHRSGIVVNGSRRGKAYSANVFADWFGATKSQRQDLLERIEANGQQTEQDVPRSLFAEITANRSLSPEEWDDILREQQMRRKKKKRRPMKL